MRRASASTCRVILVALGLLAAPAPSRSLSLAPLSLSDLVESSELVVRARCLDRVATRRNGRIESVARFEVIESLVGAETAVVEVRQWGGEVDGRSTLAPGAPLSNPEDDAVLFLAPEPDGTYRVVGASLGYLPVLTSSLARTVVRVPRVLGSEVGSRATWPLDELRERVRRLARSR